MTVIGTAIGLGAGAVFSRSIASLLFGVQPLDPATFAVAALTLGLTAILAAAGPALRAARVDSITTLRAE